MREAGDVFSRVCPVCGVGKLSYANNPKKGTDPGVKVYRRVCGSCGAVILDTVKRYREIESAN